MKKRNTRQKETLKKELEKIKGFFKAEDLFERVKEKKIGIATVYRFLKELRKNNEINSYKCNRKTIYSKNKKSHCHFHCEKTGDTMHFEIDSLDFLKGKIPGSINSIQIEVKGVCGECNKL